MTYIQTMHSGFHFAAATDSFCYNQYRLTSHYIQVTFKCSVTAILFLLCKNILFYFYNGFLPCYPSRHTASFQRLYDVYTTSQRRIDVVQTLRRRCVSTGIWASSTSRATSILGAPSSLLHFSLSLYEEFDDKFPFTKSLTTRL